MNIRKCNWDEVDGPLWVYQYDGRAPMRDILKWCREHIADRYICNGFETIFFNNEDAAAYFIMRWS